MVPISINYLNVSYNYSGTSFYPILNISLNLSNYLGPIFIVLRFTSDQNFLKNLYKNRYSFLNYIPSNESEYILNPIGWQTIYISSQCLNNSYAIKFNTGQEFFNLTSSSNYPPSLCGNINITAVAWIEINDYYYSSCADGENYISALRHQYVNTPLDTNGSTFRPIIIPNNNKYYLGIDISHAIGILNNYTLPFNQTIMAFWIYNSSDGKFYGGFVDEYGIYYGQIENYKSWILSPLNINCSLNMDILVGGIGYTICSFKGKIYELAFYNKVLSMNDIINLYYSKNLLYYDPVIYYNAMDYDPYSGILYSPINQNLSLKAYNNPQKIKTYPPQASIIVYYNIPPNYQINVVGSNISKNNCYPINARYYKEFVPVFYYPFWRYFSNLPVPKPSDHTGETFFLYGAGFSRITTYVS